MNDRDSERRGGVSLSAQESHDSDAAAEAQITANLGLAARFVAELFDDPSLLDEIPSETNVILIPPDDPDLAETNLRGGERMRLAGKPVHFYRLKS